MFNKMNCVTFILLSLITVVLGQNHCPSCDQVECFTSLGQANCARNTIFTPGEGLCNCCPGCSLAPPSGGIAFNAYGCHITKCAASLKCVDAYCRIDQAKCSHLMYIKSAYNWVPECNESDDTYKAVQCKGDRASGRCFCFSNEGERIFGWDWWRNVNDMTCACSRKRYAKEAKGEISTLHCTQNGNFEELQCDDDICWCAEPKTGEQQEGTIAVPYDMWTVLPCYNVTQMGTSYLRQCESILNAQETMKRKFSLHGAPSISMRNILCDYDGSYGIYSVTNGIASCTWRDDSRIGSYQVQANQASTMNCNCARDMKIFEENGFSLTLQCGGNGNYETLQEENLQAFCVDQDGFAVSDLLSISPTPDCDKFLYYKYTPPAV